MLPTLATETGPLPSRSAYGMPIPLLRTTATKQDSRDFERKWDMKSATYRVKTLSAAEQPAMRIWRPLLAAAKDEYQNVIDVLRARGMVHNVSSPAARGEFSVPGRTVYVGFDPTADSLHVGNLISLICLLHFQRMGHRPIAVVGGATGAIGDPSGRVQERNWLSDQQLQDNAAGITSTLLQVFRNASPSSDASTHNVLVLNNAEWYQSMNVINFFSTVGHHFRMAAMLAKDSVKQRLASTEGMSFSEFSYQTFQAYDYLHLSTEYGCVLQIGGSDQWGNITAGCDFVRRASQREVYGLTVPLLTTSSGEKIGKSSGNAVWLSANKTSCYNFYQYFVRTADNDVERCLNHFTFLPEEEVQQTMQQHKVQPDGRMAQKRLAECVTRMVHGEEGLCQAVNATSALFGSPAALQQLSRSELEQLFTDAPAYKVSREVLSQQQSVVGVLAQVSVLPSKAQGRRLVEGGGLYINHLRVSSVAEVFGNHHVLHGSLTVVRTGKSNYSLIQWV